MREEFSSRLFENWGMRKIFGPERDGLRGEWRKLHNEELNVMYCSYNIVRVIKWSGLRWAGHLERMGRGEA